MAVFYPDRMELKGNDNNELNTGTRIRNVRRHQGY